MVKICSRIYYEISTGNYLCKTYRQSGGKRQPTIDEDLARCDALKGLNKDVVDYIQLSYDYGKYANSFKTGRCIGVDLETKELIFDFTPQEQEEYNKQITLEEQQKEITLLKQQISALGKVLVQSRLKEGEK